MLVRLILAFSGTACGNVSHRRRRSQELRCTQWALWCSERPQSHIALDHRTSRYLPRRLDEAVLNPRHQGVLSVLIFGMSSASDVSEHLY